MANVLDVAEYILQDRGSMTAMKLQKLCYYSQARHLVWDDVPLFDDDFQAWANGPVCYRLYGMHRGQYTVSPGQVRGNADSLTSGERESIDVVLEAYAGMRAFELSELTHRERPWRDARGSTPPGVASNVLIAKDQMREYYEALLAS